MKKVIINKSVNIIELKELVNRDIIEQFDYDMIIEFIKDNGDGIIELCFGSRGILEEINKNDEYLSVEEVKDLYYENDCSIEDVEEFYNDNGDNNYWDDNGKIDYIFCVDYLEEGWSMFINIKN